MSLPTYLQKLLRCPACVGQGDDAGNLTQVKENWLVCQDCGRKYPIRSDIPVMLVAEGDRWQSVAVEDLPDAPPEPVVG
jgi:uncharacterized protein YbaR (Trm112 family)